MPNLSLAKGLAVFTVLEKSFTVLVFKMIRSVSSAIRDVCAQPFSTTMVIDDHSCGRKFRGQAIRNLM